MHGEAVAEHVPGHHHVRLHPVHGQPVHAQELGEQRVAVALHDKLPGVDKVSGGMDVRSGKGWPLSLLRAPT